MKKKKVVFLTTVLILMIVLGFFKPVFGATATEETGTNDIVEGLLGLSAIGSLIFLIVWVVVAIVQLFFAIVCFKIAKRKGKNTAVAFFLGLFLNIFALVYYLIAEESESQEATKLNQKRESKISTKEVV